MQRPSQGVIDSQRRGAAVLARSSGAGRRRLTGMGARSSATGDRVAPQPAAPPRRRWLLSAWTGSLNFVTALATKQALKVKPCETIEIVPLRERAERRPALSHSQNCGTLVPECCLHAIAQVSPGHDPAEADCCFQSRAI